MDIVLNLLIITVFVNWDGLESIATLIAAVIIIRLAQKELEFVTVVKIGLKESSVKFAVKGVTETQQTLYHVRSVAVMDTETAVEDCVIL